ncbi:MAG: EAL domain-containing protein [Pseudomonadota bacterium]
MTLFKQILILICLIFITLFASTFIVSTENIRDYLNEQLSSHAQDAATSLGIALTAEIRDNDIASLEVYTNAMFDSGYYKKILITDLDEKELFSKDRPLIIESVPQWFINLFPLIAPEQQATVEDGWQTVGLITIQSYPGFAYEKLWENALNTLTLYLLVMAVILFFTAIALKFLLKPLVEIKKQAHAICNREFPIINIQPKTIEFRQVVSALNKMSKKLKVIFDEQAKMTEELQKQAFQDEVTELPNRSSFMKQLKYFCDSKNETSQGGLLILHINDLLAINKKYGHLKGNELLKQLAVIINKQAESYPNSVVARLSGTDFALLVKSASTEFTNDLGPAIQKQLTELSQQLEFDDDDIAHMGLVTSQTNQSMVDLLSETDTALRLAQQKGTNAWEVFDNNNKPVVHAHGANEWNDIIHQAVKESMFQPYFQKTVDAENKSMFQEVMLRLNYQQQVISAGIFIPMAEHLGITRLIDRWVIEAIITKIKANAQYTYCMNLSRDTLQDPSFPVWLKQQFESLDHNQQQKLVIEAPEYNIIKSLSEYKNLLSIMQPFACKFSIDHFGIGFASMSYLKDIKIDYIKVHGSYASNIQENRDVVNYMRQIINTAHNLDIQVIAEGIETADDLEILKTMGLDFYQGYHIGRPEPEES